MYIFAHKYIPSAAARDIAPIMNITVFIHKKEITVCANSWSSNCFDKVNI